MSKPAFTSVGITLIAYVLPESDDTPAFNIVMLSVVTSPSFLAAQCLQPCPSSKASCSLRKFKAFEVTPNSFSTAVSLMKRLPCPVGPLAVTMIHHGVLSPQNTVNLSEGLARPSSKAKPIL
eukprot:UC4_evm5s392